jgi:hypothetical protein
MRIDDQGGQRIPIAPTKQVPIPHHPSIHFKTLRPFALQQKAAGRTCA